MEGSRAANRSAWHAYLYGLKAGGRAGVDRAVQILSDQLVRTRMSSTAAAADQA